MVVCNLGDKILAVERSQSGHGVCVIWTLKDLQNKIIYYR